MISIVTPCYNASGFIFHTIESVLSQTYTNWEMLVVDDCSTDDSAEVIKQFCKKDNRIKYLKTDKNKGNPSEPRNLALDNAKGKYIAFLDADDIWYPNKLKEQLNFLQANQYQFVYSNYEKISYEGLRDNRIVCTKKISSYKDILASNSIPCLTVLIDRNMIGNVRFKCIPLEDCAFWLQLLKMHNINAYNTGQIHALYRESKNSRSGNKWEMIRARWFLLRKVEKVNGLFSLYLMMSFLFKGYLKYLK